MISKQYLRSIAFTEIPVGIQDLYPHNIASIKHLESLELHPQVTFFVGENGAGKSTLLEAIAVASGFNPEGGSKNMRFKTAESHSKLHENIRITKGTQRPQDGFFLRAESFYNVASEIDQLHASDSYGGKSLHEQSHGESFLSLILHRFGGNGLYLLDEPEAALSPQRQLALLVRMNDLVKQKSQFIIATHSPFLLAYPNAWIYSFSSSGIERVKYEETEHYKITRDFLDDPMRTMRMLFEEELS